jgi:hypothetical protein
VVYEILYMEQCVDTQLTNKSNSVINKRSHRIDSVPNKAREFDDPSRVARRVIRGHVNSLFFFGLPADLQNLAYLQVVDTSSCIPRSLLLTKIEKIITTYSNK